MTDADQCGRCSISMCSAFVVWLQPTETLQAYFKACDEDVTPGVLKRLQELSNAIFPLPEGPSGVAFLQSTMARERRLEVGHRSLQKPRNHLFL